MTPELSRSLNAIGALAVSLILLLAFVYQLALYELPCPLCLLQRVGFMAVGVGLALNLIYGAQPQHYALMLISALFGISVSIRQIFLHIVPGTGHYGSPVLGYHYYTWAAVCFFLILLGTAIMLLFSRQYTDVPNEQPRFGGNILAKVAFFTLLGLGALNTVSALLECGPGICADPPTSYKLIDEVDANK
ncbi:disulfide bond formation protein B [Ruegeria lacuscaerulensis]|uniref:disulfide bond formation protein B n=1 Tax=Ruegeria lacuscaerulensis TaxID=55218 RepID=UPI00147F3ABD